ncbi:uncharacterized protein ARMOST_06403 [Armillaria ostoyae]|uniref:Uncharacterized protein n=1 Tax=Armillaria ostoyae TaxID=47428 RepID=A0A284R2Z3_ARMOS|nr:uncharacterized protein ARMOST_06403 [Armillaria ostoyae]
MPGFVCFVNDGTRIVKQTGASGQVASKTNSNVNSALYSTFAAMGFFTRSVSSTLRPKLTLLIDSMEYALYIGSSLAMTFHSNPDFIVNRL